jgi:hypothetical protein
MRKIDERLAEMPREIQTLLPTPVHELTVLSRQSDCRVFCKRDDLTGVGYGGNKARKLDFLIADPQRGLKAGMSFWVSRIRRGSERWILTRHPGRNRVVFLRFDQIAMIKADSRFAGIPCGER